jgi:asparagine N-glycosylation enzyme membrane subunit Stt3
MSWKKASLEGSALGVLLSLLSIWLLGIPAQTVLGAYALLLLLLSAYLTSSPRAGALVGLFAVIGESVTDFAYFVLTQNAQVSLVPYAVGFILFAGRIPVFPLFGAMGGYLGREYFAEDIKPRLRTNRGHPSRKSGGGKKEKGERD